MLVMSITIQKCNLFYSALHWRQVVVPVQEIIFQSSNSYTCTKYHLTDSNKSTTLSSGLTNTTINLSSNQTFLRRIRPRSNSPLPQKFKNKQNANIINNNISSNYNDNVNTISSQQSHESMNANSNVSSYSDVNLNLLSNANNK